MPAGMRNRIIRALDYPTTPIETAVSILLLGLIYLSVVLLVIEYRYPDFSDQYAKAFDFAGNLILTIFGLELITRLVCYRKPLRYLRSWSGLIDAAAVVTNVQRYINISPRKSRFFSFTIARSYGDLAGISKLDEDTVAFHLNTPNASMPFTMSNFFSDA